MKLRVLVFMLAFGLAGCGKQPLNPPRLVMDGETDIAIQLFVQATILLSRAYGFETVEYEQIRTRSLRAGFQTIPFMPPDTIRATSLLRTKMGEPGPALVDFLVRDFGRKPLIKYYIRTGLRASQLICRNYLMQLDEGNQYLEFIRREIGVAYTFASGVLALVNANGTLTKSFLIGRAGVDDGLNAYQEYRYLAIDRDAARNLVETAQNKYGEFFFNQVDVATIDNNVAVGGYTFSDALHAVSIIEYQCTREGIRYLLNRSINNTPSNLEIDAATGTVMFKSAKDATKEGTGSKSQTIITDPKMQLTLLDPAAAHPSAMLDFRATPFERRLSPDIIMAWQKFCNVPQTGRLGDNQSLIRQALHKLLNKPETEPARFTDRDGVLIRRAIRDKKSCAVP